MNPIVEQHTALQRTIDRSRILDRFLNDLVPDYNDDNENDAPIDHPEWGSVYHVGAHLAVKHPAASVFFREAGEPDYNIYHVSYNDLLCVLEQYDSLVLKTADYDDVNNRFLRYDTFDHGLNDAVVPSHANFVRFITVTHHGHRPQLWCTTVKPDDVAENGSLLNAETETRQFNELEGLVANATSLYLTDSNIVPPSMHVDDLQSSR